MHPRSSGGRLWFDGRIVERGDPCLDVLTDPTEQPVCCTTARMRGGYPRHAEVHRARLHRDSATLGAGKVDEGALASLWAELSNAAFGSGDDAEGIIRVEVHPAAGGETAHLLGVPRATGLEKSNWKTLRCPTIHPGAGAHRGAKLVHFPAYEEARAYSATFDVDESLLFDGAERLVEGARSNIVVVRADGSVVTPDPELGAVRGVGLSVLLDAVPEITSATISADDLREAREVIAINAVRGARAIVEHDDKPVAEGAPGKWAERLDRLLSEAGPH